MKGQNYLSIFFRSNRLLEIFQKHTYYYLKLLLSIFRPLQHIDNEQKFTSVSYKQNCIFFCQSPVLY